MSEPRCGHHGTPLEPGKDGLWCRDCFPENFPGYVPPVQRLRQINSLRPPCRTCGGKRRVPGMVMLNDRQGAAWGEVPCPDCDDGLVSVEQLAVTYNAVWAPIPQPNSQGSTPYELGYADAIVHLRKVKPDAR